MKVINLTPHEINFYGEQGVQSFPSMGVVRLEEEISWEGEVAGFPAVEKEFKDPQISGDLPKVEGDLVVLVSRLVKEKKEELREELLKRTGAERVILLAPDTGPQSVVRDENGRIIGVRRFELL